jgi:endogenous inhibitor of DNA gyrase (YacG/DUF329 family)
MSVTYSEYVFAALRNEHGMRMCHIVICVLAGSITFLILRRIERDIKKGILVFMYSTRYVQYSLCTVPVMYSARYVQCPLCTVPVMYSTRYVQYPLCTVLVMYSTRYVQRPLCTVPVMYSARYVQYPLCTVPVILVLF